VLQSRPLYDNRADGAYFLPPEEWDPLVRAIDRRLNVLLTGPRGSGKTTLLRQVQLQLRDQGKRIAYVDGTGAPGVLDLVAGVRNTLRGGEPSPVVSGAEITMSALGPRDNAVAGASRSVSMHLDAIAKEKPTIILLDATAAAGPVYELFGRLRDELWQQEHRWVVAIDESERATVMKPPADAFFDLVVAIGGVPTNRLVELLARRAGDEEGVDPKLIQNAAAGAKGNPREAIRALSNAVVNERDPADYLSERALLLDEASEIGRAPAMLMAELLDRGQASPSDEDLQATLGVSRARLTQIFRGLQASHLVIAEAERPSGPGRPRTVYRPALPR
jgi:energy-coupling factor transporter ATP-binding protein EcfA2